MKNLFVYKSFIFFVFLLSKSQILSYINLPIYTFHTVPPKPEETLKLPYYNYFHDNNIYTLIDIGLPPQKVVAKLNFDDYPFLYIIIDVIYFRVMILIYQQLLVKFLFNIY